MCDINKNIDFTQYKTIIQFLEKEDYVRIPNCENIAVSLEHSPSTFDHVVDEVWTDYPYVNLRPVKNERINILHLDGDYIFYIIAKKYETSNIESIIRAFTLEFDPAEPVNLLIKVDRNIDQEIHSIKQSIQLYKSFETYKKHVVITTSMSLADTWQIHYTGDCYIGPEIGNALFLNKPYIPCGSQVSVLRNLMRMNFKNRTKVCPYNYQEDLITYYMEKLCKI